MPACCPECGAVLSTGRLEGLCPVCLLDETEHREGGLLSEPAPATGPGLLQLPGYRMIREIARGGMGIIYEAEQVAQSRHVAVKMLLPHLLEQTNMRERFRSEVKAMAGLDHPGILPIYEVGEYMGLPFFTMKLASGGSLAANRKRYEGDWSRIASLIAEIADAIQTAHDYGVLHRDLKPANILFDEKGRACVSDFGIAKRLREEENLGLTKSATVLGTPNYMPPEWASGSAKRATTAGDIYGLGAILYELLTGVPPHTSEQLTTLLRRIADVPVENPRSLRPAVPRDLETICQKAIRREPADRYASVSALAVDLRLWLEGRPILARPATGWEKAWRWAARNPLSTSLAALLALALTLGGLALADALRTSRHRLRDALLAQAAALREGGRLGNRDSAILALNRAAEIEGNPAVRMELISALAMTGLREGSSRSYAPRGGNHRVHMDARLTRYTHRDAQGGMTVRGMADNSILTTLPPPGNAILEYGGFSPDGRYLCSRSALSANKKVDCPLRLWDVDTGVWGPPLPDGRHSCFSPDSRFLAMGHQNGTITVVDLTTGALRGPFVPGFNRDSRPYAFSPDGTRLVVGQKEGTSFEIMDAVSGRSIFRGGHPDSARVRCVTWRPDGSGVYIGTELFRIYEWMITTGSTLPRQFIGHQGNILTVEVSSSGNTLMSQSDDGTTRLWSTASAQTLAVIPCTGSEARFAPDGGSFICEDRDTGRLRKFQFLPPGVCREFSVPYPIGYAGGSRGSWRVVFSPDGGLLTVGDVDGMWHFDGFTGVVLGRSPIGSCWSLQWVTDPPRLFSASRSGVQLYTVEPKESGTAVLGPTPVPLVAQPPFPDKLNHLALSPDGDFLAVAHQEHIDIFEASGVRFLRGIGKDPARLDAVAVNLDGTLLAASRQKRAGVMVWDTATGQALNTIPTRFFESTVLFGDGKNILYTGSQDEIASWNVRTLSTHWRRPIPKSYVTVQMAMPADRSLLAANLTPESVTLLDPGTGEEITTLRHPTPHPVSGLAFSPDGTRLAVLCLGHIVQLWDLPKLRAGLAKRGLDWNRPIPAAAPALSWQIAPEPPTVSPNK